MSQAEKQQALASGYGWAEGKIHLPVGCCCVASRIPDPGMSEKQAGQAIDALVSQVIDEWNSNGKANSEKTVSIVSTLKISAPDGTESNLDVTCVFLTVGKHHRP